MQKLILLVLVALAGSAYAKDPELVIDGAIRRSGPMTRGELQPLAAPPAEWVAHGETHSVVGAPLDDVLKNLGWEPGPMGKDVPKAEKRAGYRKLVRATASDGYEAVFTCAELMPEMGGTRALVIWEMDGQPLADDMGPFRLVVLTDKEPSRSIYNLQRLEVVSLPTASKKKADTAPRPKPKLLDLDGDGASPQPRQIPKRPILPQAVKPVDPYSDGYRPGQPLH